MKQQRTTANSHGTDPLSQANANEVIDTATLDLLASWQRQDATSNPDELRAAQQELAEFKKAINENRTLSGEPVLFP